MVCQFLNKLLKKTADIYGLIFIFRFAQNKYYPKNAIYAERIGTRQRPNE